MRHQTILMGSIIAFLLSGCGAQPNKKQPPKNKSSIKVQVSEVKLSKKPTFLKYSGVIEPLVNTALSFQTMGSVSEIMVDEGDFVKKGQVLAKVNSVNVQNTYNAAMSSQKQATDAYNRLKLVYDKGSLPEIKWEEVKTKLDQANASVNIAKRNLDNATLRAPFSGFIGLRNIEIGVSVNPAVTAFELVTINDVYARVSVPENEIGKIAKGQGGTVTVGAVGEERYPAKVEKIGVVANRLSKTYEVKLRISNVGLKIKPGMVCNSKIYIKSRGNCVTIPLQAIKTGINKKPHVFVLDKSKQKVTMRTIKTGPFYGGQVTVVAGLTPGEFVVASGWQKLKNNMYVTL